MRWLLLLSLGAASFGFAPTVRADTANVDAPGAADAGGGVDVALGALGHVSNEGEGAQLDLRLRFAGGGQLGLDLGFGRAHQSWIAGFAADDARRTDLGLRFLAPLWEEGALRFSLGGRAGVRRLAGAETNAEESRSWAVNLELAALAHARLHRAVTWRAVVLVPFSLEVAPEVVNDVTGALLTTGLALRLARGLQLTPDLDAGGVFGADGDAGKFLARATVGLRFTPTASSAPSSIPRPFVARVVEDGPLLTGQNPASARELADRLLRRLGVAPAAAPEAPADTSS